METNNQQHNPTVHDKSTGRLPYHYQEWFGSAVTNASGVATFYFTEDGTSTGRPLLTSAYKSSAKFWIDQDQAFGFGSYTVITNGIQIKATELTQTTASALTSLGGSTALFIQTAFWMPAVGKTVHLSIKGNR